jgi:hypothetical protein
MRRYIGESILSLGSVFPIRALQSRAQSIEAGIEAGFQSPVQIIYSLQAFVESASLFLQRFKELEDLVLTHNSLLGELIRLPDDDNDRVVRSHQEKNNRKAVKVMKDSITVLLTRKTFSLTDAEELQRSIRGLEESLTHAQTRVSGEMNQNTRVRMSTIGSSHKIQIKENMDDDSDSLEEQFEKLTMKDDKTVVIFDESGCIPAFELIGLTRLGITLDAIVAVGDAKQLPPYDPRQSFTSKPSPRSFRSRSFSQNKTTSTSTPIKSILDVSGCSRKIKLTQQYRVPRDIATILNARIYGGDYKTPETCPVPTRGFHLIHIPSDRNEKYVNRNEIEGCLEIVRELKKRDENSIMLLTPVSSKYHWFSLGLMTSDRL